MTTTQTDVLSKARDLLRKAAATLPALRKSESAKDIAMRAAIRSLAIAVAKRTDIPVSGDDSTEQIIVKVTAAGDFMRKLKPFSLDNRVIAGSK